MATGNERDTYRSAHVVVSRMPGDHVNEMITDSDGYFRKVQEATRSIVPSFDEFRERAAREINRLIAEDLREQSQHRGLLYRVLGRIGLV